jgi:hypothetical protein
MKTGGKRKKTYLMKRVAAFGYDVWFFAGQSEAETEGFEAYRTFISVVWRGMRRNNRKGSHANGGIRMRPEGVGRGGGGGGGG